MPRITGIACAIPSHDIHAAFIGWARTRLTDARQAAIFDRMAARSGIGRRWSVLPETENGGSPVEAHGFYADGLMPPTSARMALYAEHAPALAMTAIAELGELQGITHIVVASCTGFTAPGLDQVLAARLGLESSVERVLIGFMGCYAAVTALKTARHIVRSEPGARVLVVTVELSTLHLQPATELEPLLAMLQFGDGAAAAIVEGTGQGLTLEAPFAASLPDSAGLIEWHIGDTGFAMHLSGEVPGRIAEALAVPVTRAALTGGVDATSIDAWAIHAGGRSILDAVESALGLDKCALAESREVLSENGNMSSSTLMFVLARLFARQPNRGVALAFGPWPCRRGIAFRLDRLMLAARATAEELMDADDLDAATYAAVVHDLARVNTLTLARRPTLGFLDDVRRRHGGTPLKILDVGFGDGDMLRAIARWAARRDQSVTLVGIDLNPRSAPAARDATPADMAIDYRSGDYAALAGEHWDIVLSSLVAHHMTCAQLIAFLKFMDVEASKGWFVNDLHRHGFAYLGFPVLATLMRWHPIVRHDGRLSIARSYRPDEWAPMLAEAGIKGATVSRIFPFRLCVARVR